MVKLRAAKLKILEAHVLCFFSKGRLAALLLLNFRKIVSAKNSLRKDETSGYYYFGFHGYFKRT